MQPFRDAGNEVASPTGSPGGLGPGAFHKPAKDASDKLKSPISEQAWL